MLVALSQLPNLLGLKRPGDGHEHFLVRLWLTLTAGRSDPADRRHRPGRRHLAWSVVLRTLGRALGVPLPDMLLALIVASPSRPGCWRWKAPSSAPIPAELPAFQPAGLAARLGAALTGSASPLALLGLLEALAIAKSIAVRTRQTLDYNWQCLAEGLANLGGGLFQCMPGSGSLDTLRHQLPGRGRQPAVRRHRRGRRGRRAAAARPTWRSTSRPPPWPGMLLVTAWRLVDRTRMRYCLRATPFDAGLAVATAVAAVFVSVEFSILIGVFLSFLLFVPRVPG